MPLRHKKLGVLISVRPEAAGFQHALKIADAALRKGVDVYVYCIDEALHGLDHPDWPALKERGLKLYACAYGAHQRQIPLSDKAIFAGLTVVSDVIAGTDRFLSFNA